MSEIDELGSEEDRVKARNKALSDFEDIIGSIAEFVGESPSSRRIWSCLVVDRGGVDLLSYLRKVHSPAPIRAIVYFGPTSPSCAVPPCILFNKQYSAVLSVWSSR